MVRHVAMPLAALVVLLAAAPASGRSFVVAKDGNQPSIAIDDGATTHIAWDAVDAGNTSTTHYCRVLRKGTSCAEGSERTFTPAPGDQDFGGPRVYLTGGQNVLVVTERCCTSTEGPDQQVHGSRLFAFSSTDGGATFGEATWIGTQVPDIGAAHATGAFLALGVAEDGTAIQSAPLNGFAGSSHTVTRKVADSGGIGVSPKGNMVAYADTKNRVYAGRLQGDPNTAPVKFKRIGRGEGVVVTSGPKGADLLYKTTGKRSRYIVRRYVLGKARKAKAVSEAGFPIFGTAFQDQVGRIHVAWQGDRGLTYRRSSASGRSFKKARRITRKSGYFNLVVTANRRGNATVAYDSNGFTGKVGGFTVG